MIDPKFLEECWHAKRSCPDDLRNAGLSVAVHNDYFQHGIQQTFWLMTFSHDGNVFALKGDGASDSMALDQIRAAWAELTDDHHHAPMCPANHYHGQRAPTGACSCGAIKHGVRMENHPAKIRLKESKGGGECT